MTNKPIMSLGVTLPELMTTVCIAAIVMGIAIPGFVNLIANIRMTYIANELVSDLALARSESIKRGVQITVRHKGEMARLWGDGWDVFTDFNGDGTLNMKDELVRTTNAIPEGYTLSTGANYSKWVAYEPSGLSHGNTGLANDTFTLCDSSKDMKRSRAIIVKMGRVRIDVGKKPCP